MQIAVERAPVTPLASLHTLLHLSCQLTVVDVGANPIDGVVPYSPLLENGRTRIVGFEPNPDALAKLNAAKGPNETYLPHAVADGGRHTLRLCKLSGMSSLFEPNHAVLSLFDGFSDWAQIERSVELDTVRLDDMPETAGMDMLKIDIQGGELMAFQNAPQRLSGALVVHTEVEFMPMYIGQPLFADVDLFMRASGFMLHRFEPIALRDFAPLVFGEDNYAGHSQAVWGDAIYVRDLTRLEAMDVNQLLKLAVILHDCYRSYDVVLHLLREHDRRTRKNYGDIYFDAITGAA
jgi:FkbM family methyltransferase